MASPGAAFIATSAVPGGVDTRLRAPDLCDRELGLSLPDAATRAQQLLASTGVDPNTLGFEESDVTYFARTAPDRSPMPWPTRISTG